MGQIVSSAAKPKRCNANQLSQVPTPAAGEHILVSSDNSMNAAGQGNFDCYIMGDGTTAATALPLMKTYANDVDDEPTAGSDKLVESGGIYSSIEPVKRALNGAAEVSFSASGYTLNAGTIVTDTFRSNSVYGTNYKHILIDVSAYRGRTLSVTPVSSSNGTIIAFLKNDNLVSGEVAPFCTGYSQVTNIYSTTTFTIPNDCSVLYVLYSQTDTIKYPTTLKVVGESSTFYNKTEVDGRLALKQDNLTFDETPQEYSNNPVKSKGLYPVAEKTNMMFSALKTDVNVPQDTTQGQFKPTDQNTGNNGARIWSGVINAASSSNALVTDLIEIDHSKRYRLRTQIANYFDGVAYYNNGTFVGHDVFHTTGSSQIVDAELEIPSQATHMRLASQDVSVAYAVAYVEAVVNEPAKQADLDAIEDDVEQAQNDIQYLFGVAEAQGVIDTTNAVKIIPTKTLYLGQNILDITSVTFDSTYWSVVNGVINYLGGGSSSTPFVFNAATTSGKKYLAEITDSSGGTNLFNIAIGDGLPVDTYNGTQNTFGGLISDGGLFKIIPVSNNTFSLTSVSLAEVLNSAEDVGYDKTIVLDVNNVSAGNSAQTIIDGKWNVAIGPVACTMANNVNGSRSIAIGFNALNQWFNGLQNIAIGTFAAYLLESGNYNVVIGSDAMWQVKKANRNIVIGRSSLGKTGEYDEVQRNVVIGTGAMREQQSGASDSVSIGDGANVYGVPSSVFIGSGSTTTYANRQITNAIAIGYFTRATKSNQCVLGNASVSEFVLGNKKLIFNQDGTVSWESVS